ncbi:MAG: radical SAM protein [Deltaproteobacteria bacterium]|nr:radical SAM protein [Deltaproteobacteria bacterium]
MVLSRFESPEGEIFSCYKACRLCPRQCGIDRTSGQKGFCGEGAHMRIAAIVAHHGEEPPISGKRGSGAVFFAGCSLGCLFCQNHQISREGVGRVWSVQEVADRLVELYEESGIHNVNYVTSDHFFPHTMEIANLLQERGVRIPVVHNLSGYQSLESLRMIESASDIYLADFKYGESALAQSLARCADYPAVALEALSEMVRQKGFLDTFSGSDENLATWSQGESILSTAGKGVLVRHLILPGYVENSLEVLKMLFLEFGRDLPLSLMSQYAPVRRFPSGSPLNRRVTGKEFDMVLDYALELGFRNLFVQYPDGEGESLPFLPDFRETDPFPATRAGREG